MVKNVEAFLPLPALSHSFQSVTGVNGKALLRWLDVDDLLETGQSLQELCQQAMGNLDVAISSDLLMRPVRPMLPYQVEAQTSTGDVYDMVNPLG
jgi:hypothetical protein